MGDKKTFMGLMPGINTRYLTSKFLNKTNYDVISIEFSQPAYLNILEQKKANLTTEILRSNFLRELNEDTTALFLDSLCSELLAIDEYVQNNPVALNFAQNTHYSSDDMQDVFERLPDTYLQLLKLPVDQFVDRVFSLYDYPLLATKSNNIQFHKMNDEVACSLSNLNGDVLHFTSLENIETPVASDICVDPIKNLYTMFEGYTIDRRRLIDEID